MNQVGTYIFCFYAQRNPTAHPAPGGTIFVQPRQLPLQRYARLSLHTQNDRGSGDEREDGRGDGPREEDRAPLLASDGDARAERRAKRARKR